MTKIPVIDRLVSTFFQKLITIVAGMSLIPFHDLIAYYIQKHSKLLHGPRGYRYMCDDFVNPIVFPNLLYCDLAIVDKYHTFAQRWKNTCLYQ